MNFIEIYDNIYNKEDCQKIIDLFENDPNKTSGITGSGTIRKEIKKSTDIGVYTNEKNPYNDILLPKMIPCLEHYKKRYPAIDDLEKWGISPSYCIQKYGDGDGYFMEHCEHGAVFPKRILAWMVYLNNAKCGTKFVYQRKVTKATRGRLVIWPAFWTHAHCGVTPNRGEKYIATGWFELF